MKNEKDFYCRQRDCIYHKGFSKNKNVICSKRKPYIVRTKNGIFCNSIFIKDKKELEPSKLKQLKTN